MALPKWAITVTPFSRRLALLLFIALPIFGFYLGTQFQQIVDTANQQIVFSTPLPVQSSSPSAAPSVKFCKTISDCGANEYCSVSGPLIYDPVTKKIKNPATCHDNGTVVPF